MNLNFPSLRIQNQTEKNSKTANFRSTLEGIRFSTCIKLAIERGIRIVVALGENPNQSSVSFALERSPTVRREKIQFVAGGFHGFNLRFLH